MLRVKHLASLFTSLLPLGISAGGCAAPLGPFDTTAACDQLSSRLAKISPVAGTDFVVLLQQMPGAPLTQSEAVAQWGTECATATQPDACQAAFAKLGFASLFALGASNFPTSFDVAFTRGNDARLVTTRDELVQLLAPIDTPDEAVLVANASHFTVACDGKGNVGRQSDGYVLLGTKGDPCVEDIVSFEIFVSASGAVTTGRSEVTQPFDPTACATTGRRPNGLVSRTGPSRSAGEYFAEVAHLEAASIVAFAELGRELVLHGAPTALVRAARRARRDEIAHARTTSRFARKLGVTRMTPVKSRPTPRSLVDIALDNTSEGCVRETFGALVALHQSACAGNASIRKAYRQIAKDETRHATFSWALDAWLRRRLSPSIRAKLDDARRKAVAALERDLEVELPSEIRTVAGLPGSEASLRFARGLDAALWKTNVAAA